MDQRRLAISSRNARRAADGSAPCARTHSPGQSLAETLAPGAISHDPGVYAFGARTLALVPDVLSCGCDAVWVDDCAPGRFLDLVLCTIASDNPDRFSVGLFHDRRVDRHENRHRL